MTSKMKLKTKLLLLFLICCMGAFLELRVGTGANLEIQSIFALRLPRVAMALGSGVALGLSGLLIQSLFSNPMAEPYTLGTASLAAVGGLLVGDFFPLQSPLISRTMGSFFGALTCGLILLFLDRKYSIGNHKILLFGMTLSLFGGSVVAAYLTVAHTLDSIGMMGWLYGDLARWEAWIGFVVFLIALGIALFFWSKAKYLDALLFGTEEAIDLGVPYSKLKFQILFFTSLLVGLAVSLSGIIGFVGLIAPHFSRGIFGAAHKKAILGTILIGPCLLLWGDWSIRYTLFPLEIPAGVMTALFGAPFFVYILLKNRGNS